MLEIFLELILRRIPDVIYTISKQEFKTRDF